MGATTAWLDDDEMEAWRAFIETVVDLMGALEADLAEHHLTMGDYQVLVFLSEVPDLRDADVRPRGAPAALAEQRRDGWTDSCGRASWSGSRRSTIGGVMLAVLTEAGVGRARSAAPTHVESVRNRLFDHVERRTWRRWPACSRACGPGSTPTALPGRCAS